MGLPVSVHSQKYGVILRLPAPAEQDSKLMGVRPGGVVPGNTVVHGDIRPAAGGGSACAPQDGMGFAEGDHPGDKRKEILIFGQILPVQPGNFIVLAVRVVVPELGIAKFVPGQEHGRSSAAKKDGEGIFPHPVPERQNLRIVRGAFCAAVPAVVGVGAVGVSVAVSLVVLMVVGVEVVKGKAVVAGNEIYRSIDAPAGRVEIRGAADTLYGCLAKPSSPFRKQRMSSRYLPFHSAQRFQSGKEPT